MRNSFRSFTALVLLGAVSVVPTACSKGAPVRQAGAKRPAAPEVLLRLDDVGMNHSVNTAIAKVAATRMPFSVSVLFVCPWYQEAVEILRANPQVAVGVHLALNSEWEGYRWGPVLGEGGVPSLVDSVGYLRPSRDEFLKSKYDLGEVERELSAQVDRAMKSGLKISYVDTHMNTAESTPELRAIVEKIAKKYNLGISTYFGESYKTMWGVPVKEKKRQLLSHLANAKQDQVNLVEIHVAERSPEMSVIVDMNAPSQNTPDAGVMAHRSAELEMVTSSELRDLAESGQIKLVTYRTLVDRSGPLSSRPTP
jgi:chitin disaccharide deacetylase